MDLPYRKTSQFLMPAVKPVADPDSYDIYPAFNIGNNKISRGLAGIAEKIATERVVLIDGFPGIFFESLRSDIDLMLRLNYKISAKWIDARNFLKPEDEINEMILPFLGGDDPVFGKRATISLKDFFSEDKISEAETEGQKLPVIIYGTGSSLVCDDGFLIYIDLPKNEFHFRSRAGTATNIGTSIAADPKYIYKRSYFVDWVVCGNHKQNLLDRIDILADGQRPDDITWAEGGIFRQALNEMSHSALRARPWFEPGAWGGTWIKKKIKGIITDVPNYAWSFELITPENGLIIESSGLMVEFSFDFLMFREGSAVLGESYTRFGTEFPVRFDFLDTFDGGNLSVQCHPRPGYMKENFGENFTQEETYYILDTKENADVYLGFQEEIDCEDFRSSLEESWLLNKHVDVEKFVQKHPSHRHDLFLIPSGTIHSSGKNNLVLEISSTPYIYTFKMYDWLRPDLDGNPRPLNISRGMENLYFDRKGQKVRDELLCKPILIEEGTDWQKYHLPTHPTQLYDIYRYHFKNSIEINTLKKCHILSLVEGKTIIVETTGKHRQKFCYAETFVIPAATSQYRIINRSVNTAILIVAFIK
jgi:mannose-6-phosphate isomerase class I